MSKGNFKLLVGLGNPGSCYSSSRHNVGFMALQRLAEQESASFSLNKKLFGQIAEIGIGLEKRRLLMPNTFMNDSGRSVQAAMQWFDLKIDQLIVIVDDMDLPLGKLRVRSEGGAGGHNGLKSIINCLGTKSFSRLRVGIGHPIGTSVESRSSTVSHVLGTFNAKEKVIIDDILKEVVLGLNLIPTVGLEKTANRINSFKPNLEDK